MKIKNKSFKIIGLLPVIFFILSQNTHFYWLNNLQWLSGPYVLAILITLVQFYRKRKSLDLFDKAVGVSNIFLFLSTLLAVWFSMLMSEFDF